MKATIIKALLYTGATVLTTLWLVCTTVLLFNLDKVN